MSNRTNRRIPDQKNPPSGNSQPDQRLSDLAALGSTSEILKTVIRSSPLAIIGIDMDYRVLLWNPAAEILFGWREEEVIGRPIPTFPRDEEGQIELDNLNKEMQQGRTSLIKRTRRLRKDGTIFEASVSVAPLQGPTGTIIGAIGIIADITDQKQAEDLYRTLAESSYAGVYVVQNGTLQFVNLRGASYTGYTREELIGVDPLSLIHPDDVNDAKAGVSLMLQGKRTVPYEFRIVTRDGKIRWIMETVTPIRFHGAPAILMNSMDITERRQMEDTLRQSEERYRAIIENIEDGYYEANLKGCFTFFNDACEGIFGYGKEELIGLKYTRIADSETAKTVFEIFNRVYVTGHPEKAVEWAVIRKDGSKGHIEVSISLIRNRAGEPIGFRGILHDITARKASEAAITHLAYHDVLTGLPNRTLFSDRLSRAIAQSQRKGMNFALLILDLDNFKIVNDSLGHEIGDRLLRSVGERISGLLRNVDTVARMGGDEFLILLEDMILAEHAVTISRKILKAFEQPFRLDHHVLHVSTSIGIAVYPDDGDSDEILMKNADTALYCAKREGRKQVRRYLSLMNTDLSQDQ